VRCIDPPRANRRLRRAALAAGAFVVLCALPACHTPPPRAVDVALPARTPAPPPAASRARPAASVQEYQLQIAARLMAANPTITYATPAPDPLLAIPVLEVEVNADGSMRHITVLRVPTQAQDTLQIAIDAVRRAAPFGDVTHVPKPWKFTEVFLFDDDRRFKPRVLD